MRTLTIIIILLVFCALSIFWSNSVFYLNPKPEIELASNFHDIVIASPIEKPLNVAEIATKKPMHTHMNPSEFVLNPSTAQCIPDRSALDYKSPHMVKPPESDRIFVCCATTKGDMTIGENMCITSFFSRFIDIFLMVKQRCIRIGPQ